MASCFRNAFYLDLVKHAILPILVVSVGQIGVYARYVRANTVSQMEEEYVLTAVSKGTSPMKILFRHVLKNCMLPIITLVGMSLVNLVTGSFIIESVFGWPGIGTFSITSLNNRDYPVVMAITMLSCTVLVVGIFLSNILYTLIDPRIKTKGQASYE